MSIENLGAALLAYGPLSGRIGRRPVTVSVRCQSSRVSLQQDGGAPSTITHDLFGEPVSRQTLHVGLCETHRPMIAPTVEAALLFHWHMVRHLTAPIVANVVYRWH